MLCRAPALLRFGKASCGRTSQRRPALPCPARASASAASVLLLLTSLSASMAPQKFASVRHKARPPARLASFRDDSGLVALRYEQTRQAEPPIPLPPPRNPLRISLTPSGTGAPRTRTAIIVIPPPVAPPQEEHPLFRTQRPAPSHANGAGNDNGWKRDSGAPTTSSSITLRDEHDEDPVFRKLFDHNSDAPSVFCSDEQTLKDAASPILELPSTPPSPDLTAVPQKLSTAVGYRDADSDSKNTPASPTESARPISLTKKLSKTFSIRSAATKRLRKRSLSTDGRAASPDAPPSTMRGSPNKSPKSPPRSWARSPASNRKGRDPGPSQASGSDADFAPITTLIPDDSLWDDFGNLSFSKRGSIMFGGKAGFPFGRDAPPAPSSSADAASVTPAQPQVATPAAGGGDATDEKLHASPHDESPSVPSIRVVSIDVERESQKFFSLRSSAKRPAYRAFSKYHYATVGQFIISTTR